jgi:hypothetical protein
MRRLGPVIASVLIAAGATGLGAEAVTTAMARPSTAALAQSSMECGARDARSTVTRFLAAFNRGDLRKLNVLVALGAGFDSYAVNGGPGQRVRRAASNRSTLIPYFAERHRRSERLVLMRFGVDRRSLGKASFWFELLRRADDLKPEALYVGKGAVGCNRRRAIAAWAMGPNGQPTLPAPQSYAETCRLVGSWCELEPSPGGLPPGLRRPLSLPAIGLGGTCPTTKGQRFDGQFGGVALGEGPVQPLIAGGGARTEQGVIVFRPYAARRRGWYRAKTLWFARPDYGGPVLIRGRQLDGTRAVILGEAPSLVDPQMGPGATLNGREGWREWPGGTWLRTPGCYAWQIDGTDFSQVIVFQAVFRPPD